MEFTIALVGDRKVGKTTFIKRLQTGIFEERYLPTHGCQETKLKFSTNIGEVCFNIRDCGKDATNSSYEGLDGAIVMHDNRTDFAIHYNPIRKFAGKEVFIVNFCNDRTENVLSVKTAKDTNTLVRPFISLLRLLKDDFSIFFNEIVEENRKEKSEEDNFTPKAIADMVNSNDSEKIFWVGHAEGMIKITANFYNNGELVEQISSPNKIIWTSVPDGIIRVIYQYYKNGDSVVQ